MQTDIQQLIDYISKYDSSFASRIRGASEMQINRLEQLIKHPLPTTYRAFLSRMGHSMGGLHPYNANFDIDVIIRAYESDSWMPPSQYLFIGLAKEDPFLNIYLDCSDMNVEPKVVQFPDPPDNVFSTERYFYMLYQSVSDMLFAFAFLQIRMPQLPARARYIPNPQIDWKSFSTKTRMQALHDVSLKKGFQLLPVTGSWTGLYEKNSAAIIGYQPENYGLYVEIATQDYALLEEIASNVTNAVGLVEQS